MRVSSRLVTGTVGATALFAALYMPSGSDARPSADAALDKVVQDIKSKVAGLDALLHPLAQADKEPVNPYWSSAIWEKWQDGKGQSRSPCPMLNTLANHGLLNYNGRGIDAPTLQSVLSNYLGVRGNMLNTLMQGHTQLSAAHAKKFGGDGTTFDLEDGAIHNVLEHDVSLTRERYIASDPLRALPANVTKIHEFLQYAENGVLTYKSLTRFRDVVKNREFNDGLQPPAQFDLTRQVTAYGEAILLLEIVGRNGQLRVEEAEEFLTNERFPRSYKALPPSSINDAYMFSRVVEQFGLEVAMKFFGLSSAQDVQNIAASVPSQ